MLEGGEGPRRGRPSRQRGQSFPAETWEGAQALRPDHLGVWCGSAAPSSAALGKLLHFSMQLIFLMGKMEIQTPYILPRVVRMIK